ncbi:hypothetical protein Pmani_004077 [Petrolisthes manimaculis]|uniref:G-protein coupled receptors family 1 profile domain-containing protein n=1 Tax=Petrolisthes manimaculis TaxID=1843537 RepID=A0AAE1QHA6_9EUCA|nr:hypothetical protein Pmani_004077 [Petrolisthes manimaculis]
MDDYSDHYDYHYDYGCLNCTFPTHEYSLANDPLLIQEIVLLILGVVVGVPGNIGVFYMVKSKPELRSITTTYILHRAVADSLFFNGDMIKLINYFMRHWKFGEIICKIYAALLQVPVFASTMFLVLMNVDLYLRLVQVKNQNNKAKRQQIMQVGAAGVWTITLVSAILVSIYSGLDDNFETCWVLPVMVTAQQLSVLEISIMLLCYALPLALSWGFYAQYVKASSTPLSSEDSEASGKDKKLMLVLNVTFTVCQSLYWLSRSFLVPFHINMGTLVMFVILHYCLELSLVLSVVFTLYYKMLRRGQPENPHIALPLMS